MEDEKQKMLSGRPYNALAKPLMAERRQAKELIFDLNNLRPGEMKQRNALLQKLLGKTPRSFFIESPFRCDYGYNIEIGENFFANYNCTILDCARVSIGNDVMFGPNVSLFTAGHPIHHEARAKGLEYAFPITIGDNVWIGGNTVVNAGVTIGENTVIGSGSVVTKDIPANVIAFGNPCKVLREITESDKAFYYKSLKFEDV